MPSFGSHARLVHLVEALSRVLVDRLADQLDNVVVGERLLLEECARHGVQLVHVGLERALDLHVRLGDELVDLEVDEVAQLAAVGLGAERAAAAGALLLSRGKREIADALVHAERLDLGVGESRDPLEVLLALRRVLVEDERLGHSAAEEQAHLVEELLFGDDLAVRAQVVRERVRLGARE